MLLLLSVRTKALQELLIANSLPELAHRTCRELETALAPAERARNGPRTSCRELGRNGPSSSLPIVVPRPFIIWIQMNGGGQAPKGAAGEALGSTRVLNLRSSLRLSYHMERY